MLNLLCSHERLMSILGDPYGIFLVVLESLYISVDLIVHRMGWVLSGIETVRTPTAYRYLHILVCANIVAESRKRLSTLMNT